MNPILFEFNGFALRYYGLMYALALLICHPMLKADRPWHGLQRLSDDRLMDLLIYSFFAGLAGARLYYVALNGEHYFNSVQPWWEFLAIWHGGLAIHGALLAAPLALWGLAKRQGLPFLPLLDLFACQMLLGQAIGRLGNLMNGDAHGLPTNQPWGLVFPYGPAAYEFPGQTLHPVMLYESLLCLGGWLVLRSLRKGGFQPGFFACLYVMLYAAIRGFTSQFRADDLYLAGLKAPYLVSLAGFALALALLLRFRLYQKRHHS